MRFNEFHDQQADEMIGVKKYHDFTIDHATELVAKDLGTKVLGGGAYGTVIQSSNSDVVYKVLESDAGYMRFVRLVQQYPDKHYPKIYKVKNLTSFFKRYRVQNDKFYVIALETLFPIDEKKTGMKATFIASLLNTYSPKEAPKLMPNGHNNINQVPTSEFLQFMPELKSLWTAYMKVKGALQESSDYFPDIHTGNLMMRKDGTVVITDPMGSYSGAEYKADIAFAQQEKEPMIKGPHYRTEPAQASPDDDENIRYIKQQIADLEAKQGQLEPLDQIKLNSLKRILSAKIQDLQ